MHTRIDEGRKCHYHKWAEFTANYALSMLVYTTLHCHTIVQLLYSCVNSIDVTVNICTCTDVFTITTTKDPSGGIHNSYSTGRQGFTAVSKQTSSLGYALGVGLCTGINPWACAIIICGCSLCKMLSKF